MDESIKTYNQVQEGSYKELCDLLANELQNELQNVTSKVWHGHPVWFIDGNPIAGYSVRKKGVQLLFWSGQSFDEQGLSDEGSFKASEKYYGNIADVDPDDLRGWLKKAETIQWDYKNIVKRRGELVKIGSW